MAYTPENNPYIPGDPYSYDLKWMVNDIKHMEERFGELDSQVQEATDQADRSRDEADRSDAEALKAEGFAVGEQDETPVDPDSPYYENNAKFYAEKAQLDGHAEVLKAEGYANGEAEGVPITDPASPYYHNNSKYYAEEAADSEQAAADYAAHIADPVSGLVTSWLADNITQPTTPAIDTSLTVGGAAADAKVVGDRFTAIGTDLLVKKSYRQDFIRGCYVNDTNYNDNGGYRSLLLDVVPGEVYHYWGSIKLNIVCMIVFTDDNGVNKGYYNRGDNTVITVSDTAVTVPADATKMYVSFFVDDPQDYQFDLYKMVYAAHNQWNGKTIMCIGDSLTQGVYWDGAQQVDSPYPYPFYLTDLLQAGNVINLGASGMTVANNPDQVQWLWLNDRLTLQSYKDENDLVIVFAGTNDFGLNTPLGTLTSIDPTNFYGALNQAMFTLLNRFNQKYKKHRIVLCTPLHRLGDTTPNSEGLTLKDYRDAIIAIAERYSVDCIDLFSCSGINAIGGLADTNALLSDGLHLSKIIGYQRLGEIIAEKLSYI